MPESPKKKAKTAPKPWVERLAEAREAAKSNHTREQMMDAVFHTWDRDGGGTLSFEEILPHYMKSSNHLELQEKSVREGYEAFMDAEGCKPDHGITPSLFRKWLAPLNDDQVATQYVRHVEGITENPYGMNINHAVTKEYHDKTLKEVLDAPIHALLGLGHVAEVELAALGLKTVRDLGNWRFFHIASAICALADTEDEGFPAQKSRVNIREALHMEHESKTLKEVMQLPPSALNMFPHKADEVLKHLRIQTIKSLGNRKVLKWAAAMVALEQYEGAAAAASS